MSFCSEAFDKASHDFVYKPEGHKLSQLLLVNSPFFYKGFRHVNHMLDAGVPR